MKFIAVFIMLFLLVSCGSKKSDKELFDDAQRNLKEDKIPEAVIAYEELISNYSESNLAPEALSQLASVYQNKRIKSLSEKENLEKAVMLFKKIHTDYPQSSYAPTGLFMAGFISANELKNFDQATEIYNQFLKEYPDHDLIVSAKAELENMGLTPEEILKKNLAKEN